MSEYQLVPYSFSVHVSGKPGERRPLDDLDAAGLTAVEFIAQAARAHAGEPRLEDKKATTALQIQQVARSERVVAITAGSGQRGIVAEVVQSRQGKTTRTAILANDWTHTHLRNVFYAPPGAAVGIALIERVGHAGVVSKINKLLRASLLAKHHGLLFTMQPAMSPAAIESWAADARVKGIVLRHTHQTTGESAHKLAGLPFGQVLEFRAPRRKSWSTKVFGGLLNEEAQKTILTEVVPQLPGVSAEEAEKVALQMIEDGWSVSLDLRKGSRQRLVQVATKASITMTYPASVKDADGLSEHDDFVQACQNALTEMSSDGMSVGTPTLCSWDDKEWTSGSATWKAVWGVPESDTTSSTA